MKVLVAESDTDLRFTLEKTLDDWGYQSVLAATGEEAKNILQSDEPPSIALIDWTMRDIPGAELCSKTSRSGKGARVYIIALTPKGEIEEATRAIAIGADDFLNKPFDNEELRMRLHAGRRIVDLQEALRIQATHDTLTGVWNRGMILEVLQRELARVARDNATVGIILIDIDNFKQINDNYGHRAGDEVLRIVSKRLQAALRAYDLLGRYASEEFLIVLPGCEVLNALKVADRARNGTTAAPIKASVWTIPLTVSIGVATAGKGQRLNVDELIQAADDVLQKARKSGKNRIEWVED